MLRAGTSSSLGAGQDVNFAAQGASLHAASGKLSVQSQSDAMLTADKAVTVQREDGTLLNGTLDQFGRTARLFTETPRKLRCW